MEFRPSRSEDIEIVPSEGPNEILTFTIKLKEAPYPLFPPLKPKTRSTIRIVERTTPQCQHKIEEPSRKALHHSYTCENCKFTSIFKDIVIDHVKDSCHSASNLIFRRKVFNKTECAECLYRSDCDRCFIGHPCSTKYREKHLGHVYKCGICYFESEDSSLLEDHYNLEHVRPYICNFCAFYCKQKRELSIHKSTMHKTNGKLDCNTLLCEFCGVKFVSRNKLSRHQVQRHTAREDVQWYKCQQCDYKGKTNGLLRSHTYHQHTADDKIRWHNCRLCSYRAKMNVELTKHVKAKHGGLEALKCEDCQFKAKSRKALYNHIFQKHK